SGGAVCRARRPAPVESERRGAPVKAESWGGGSPLGGGCSLGCCAAPAAWPRQASRNTEGYGAVESSTPDASRLPRATGRALAGQQLAIHTERSVEFTGEGENPRGRKGNLELHLALGGNVLIDRERGNGDIVQGARLVLHQQRQLLPGLATQEGRREVIVVGLEF